MDKIVRQFKERDEYLNIICRRKKLLQSTNEETGSTHSHKRRVHWDAFAVTENEADMHKLL
jgi:hypothetical protein